MLMRKAVERAYLGNVTNIDKLHITHELYNALVCKAVSIDDLALSLPPRLDMCWHQFILETKPYEEFCNQVCGRFLHHSSTTVNDSVAQKQNRVDQTIAVYKTVFRRDPTTSVNNSIRSAKTLNV